jgi:isopenicillin N synthase-like dioxygenase
VVEPVSDVAGLDVFDQESEQWLNVEGASGRPGSDWVLFGGRCIEKATNGHIKACLHRVTADGYHQKHSEGKRRFCFIFEQKLSEFYE